jgi:HSP20 family protein
MEGDMAGKKQSSKKGAAAVEEIIKRLAEVGEKLSGDFTNTESGMAGKKQSSPKGFAAFEGILGGLGDLAEKLNDLTERGASLSRSGEIPLGGKDKDIKGVFGFSVKMGLGGKDVKVEPFGNVKRDKTTGKGIVEEIREPLVDVFEEEGHVQVVAEMPGIEAEDLRIELKDDILTFTAERGDKRYRKEVLLPDGTFDPDRLIISCKNGMVEIKCPR